mgnify:CR=1 FL=1
MSRAAEEWGRAAVSLPGFRWMPGMLAADTELRLDEMTTDWEGARPDPDDPATAGCLLALLGDVVSRLHYLPSTKSWAILLDAEGMPRTVLGGPPIIGATLGRACIAAAEALGRWPGGEA